MLLWLDIIEVELSNSLITLRTHRDQGGHEHANEKGNTPLVNRRGLEEGRHPWLASKETADDVSTGPIQPFPPR
jgi:hypothetical protein